MNSSQSYFSIFLRNQLNLCALCLSQNRHYVKNLGLLRRILEDFPKLLLDFNVHEDRICWECNARLQQLVRFHNRILQAKRTLSNLSNLPGEGNVPKIHSVSTLSRSLVRGKVHIVPMRSFLPAAIQNMKEKLEIRKQQEQTATPQMELQPLQPRITSVSSLSQNSVGKLNIVPLSTLRPSEPQPTVKIEFEEILPDEPGTADDIKEESEEDEELPLQSEPKSSSTNTLDLDDVLASMYVQKPKLFQHSPQLHLPIKSLIPSYEIQVTSKLQTIEKDPPAPKQMTVTSGPSKQDTPSTGNNDIKIAILSKTMVMELREKERQYLCYLKTGFNCEKCVFNIENETVYKNHMARHDPSAGPEVCDICEMRYETKEALLPHYKSHFRAFACLRCRGRTFVCRLWSTMTTHMKIHDNPGWAGCSECGSAFESKLLLQSHIEKMHRVYCTKCKQKFRSQFKLDQHILRLHTEAKCDKCHTTMKGQRGLEYHKRKSRLCDSIGDEGVVIPVEDGSSQHFCGKCNKFFKTRLCLFAHIKSSSQHADMRFECDYCGKVYSTKCSIAAHIQFKHNNKGYACQTCGKKFATKRTLRVHENYVHLKKRLEAKYTCDVCGKAFTTNAMLKIHLLIHSGIRQHQCQLCPWNFTQKSTLVTHMRLKHKTGKKPVKTAESGAVKQRKKKK